MSEPQQTWTLYDKDGQAVPQLYVVNGGRVERPATTYEQEQWTRWDEIRANSAKIGFWLWFAIFMGLLSWGIAAKLGFYGLWGPLVLCAVCLGLWYMCQRRKERGLGK